MCAHVLCARVGLWELMKQRLLRSFSLIGWKGFAGQSVQVLFWFVLFLWHAVGCLGQHGCCSIDHPLYRQDLFGWVLFVGVVCCVRTV